MFWVYTIIGGLCAVGVAFCGIMAVYYDRQIVKEPGTKTEYSPNVYNVKGDLVQGNVTEINNNSKNANSILKTKKMEDKESKASGAQSIIHNNGNFVNGDVNGDLQQTINNYAPQPRRLNEETKNDLHSIPKDFKIHVICAPSEEAINYANEIIAYISENLKLTNIESQTMNWIQGWNEAGEKRQEESFNLIINPDKKTASILVQKR